MRSTPWNWPRRLSCPTIPDFSGMQVLIPDQMTIHKKLKSNRMIFRFELPSPTHCLGLPIGQHIYLSARCSPPPLSVNQPYLITGSMAPWLWGLILQHPVMRTWGTWILSSRWPVMVMMTSDQFWFKVPLRDAHELFAGLSRKCSSQISWWWKNDAAPWVALQWVNFEYPWSDAYI